MALAHKKKPVDLEKEGRVIFDMLDEHFPRKGRRQPPTPAVQYYYPRSLCVPSIHSTEEEETLDCIQAARIHGGVVFVSHPHRKKVDNKRPNESTFYLRPA